MTFTRKQVDELIRLGWAPEYDDAMNIVGFDKTVAGGDPVVVPDGMKHVLIPAESAYRVWSGYIEVVSRKWHIYPKSVRKVRFA